MMEVASKPREHTPEQMTEISAFIQAKIDKEQLNQEYKAENYFNDYYEVEEKFGFVNSMLIGRLQGMAQENSTTEEMSTVAKKFKEKIEAKISHRDEFMANVRDLRLVGILTWLANAYLYLLPWFFVLFVIWAIEGSDNKKTFFRHPLGFTVSIIVYPAIAIYVLVKWMILTERKVLVATELRRTKENIFCAFSEDEVAKIKKITQGSLSASNWRKSLGIEGKKNYHAFSAAMTVVVLLMIVSKPLLLEAENYSTSKTMLTNQSTKSTINILPTTSPPANFHDNDSSVWWEKITDFVSAVSLTIEWYREIISQLYIKIVARCLDGFVMEIEHIPDTLTFTWLTNRNYQFKIIRSINNVYNKENNRQINSSKYSAFIFNY
ncbi:MAG: hypothetical protein PHR00_01090 [Patescibacteria group bacterium]|nr:hypothetical protein [Patescibacteria group bacterium]